MSALRSDMAMRHPKRGKAHRGIPARDLWSGRSYIATACGLPKGAAERMSETIEVARIDPSDRCRTCWPMSTQ